jgi:hypothetical protein
MSMQAHQKIITERDACRGRAAHELRPVFDRDGASAAHFRRCGLLHIDHTGNRSGAAQFPEDVINIVHVDTYNIIRVSVST